jgi:hypothetical protein
MVKHADVGMTVTKEGFCFTHRSLEAGGMAHHAGPHGGAQGLVRKQKEQREIVGISLSCGLHNKEQARPCKQL